MTNSTGSASGRTGPSRRSFLGLSATAGATAALLAESAARADDLAPAPTTSGTTALRLAAADRAAGGKRILVQDASGRTVARFEDPIVIAVKIGDSSVPTRAGYSSAQITASLNGAITGMRATQSVRTPAGSVFAVTDDIAVQRESVPEGLDADAHPPARVRVRRTVTVTSAATLKELGFSSRIGVALPEEGPSGDHDVLLPGVRWGDTVGLPQSARGTGSRATQVREMRLTLPFAGLRRRTGGRAILLEHSAADPRTNDEGYVPEPDGNWWINEDIRFAALGVDSSSHPELVLEYPAVEGEDDGSTATWNRRGHPVRVGFSHRYTVDLRVATEPDFPAFGRAAWRRLWAVWRRPTEPSPAGRVADAATELLAGYTDSYNTKPGLPFRSRLPSGDPDAISYVMGFIGQQAPAGYQLLRTGRSRGDSRLIESGRSIVDFWATESPLPNGLPRLWIDGDTPTWRDGYPGFLRVATDGMLGILDAARLERRRGHPVTTWESAVTRFGDFLLAHQNPDGSFPRAWNQDGSVQSPETSNTTHAIPFLIQLATLMRRSEYREAAVRAGGFARNDTAGSWHFVGGTADNPNILDKEGAGLALRAFLALHGATGDDGWLDPARRAADAAETWICAWPFRVQTPRPAYRQQGPLGLGVIAAGNSGVDNWLTYEAADFYRLGVVDDDEHYRDVARFLLTTGFRTTQYAGNDVGYRRRGLVEEAITLADLVVDGTGMWLPWCSVAQLEPLSILEDEFGDADVGALDRLPLSELRARRDRAQGRI